jgi:hypothetical protein
MSETNTNSTPSTDNINEQLWDEITKSIAGKMPAQFLFPSATIKTDIKLHWFDFNM